MRWSLFVIGQWTWHSMDQSQWRVTMTLHCRGSTNFYSHPSPPMKDSHQVPKASSISILSISSDQLSSLKTKTRNQNDTVHCSSYETLAAHIWRCACMARGLDADQVTKLFIATDGRSRLCPPLPAVFFGNVVFSATPIATSGEITSQPLMSTVKTIRNALMKMNDEYLRSAVDYLELKDPSSLVRGAHTFRCPNVNIVSWMRLPIYDADFGWGRPIYMGPSEVMFEGLSFILPSPTKNGSFSVVIRLEPNHLKQFEKLFYQLMAI